MGQRLVIEIQDNGKSLANAYYHWSAYTGSAAELTNQILGYLEDADKAYTSLQKAVYALYKTGARINESERISQKNENIDSTPFNFVFDGKTADRNHGLLCVSEWGKQENRDWEEGVVEIDISDCTIYFDVLSIMSADTYEAIRSGDGEYADPELKTLPELSFSESGLRMSEKEWAMFYTRLMHLLDNGKYIAVSPDHTTVYQFIE